MPARTREQETGHDQLKTHLRGPGRLLRSKLAELVYQEIWAWLVVHYALAALVTRAAEAAEVDPDRVSYIRALRIARRTATGTAGFPPEDWTQALPAVHAEITRKLNPPRRHRNCPRAVKRARHNSYRVKKPDQAASTRHAGPATIRFWPLKPPPTAQAHVSTAAEIWFWLTFVDRGWPLVQPLTGRGVPVYGADRAWRGRTSAAST
ncbi:MAG TPA: hypothetical protein VFM55_14605, partial [Micromonosporaceae bacterium]|nr:hypothetical protein [Micromonosporaceae bacterium]